MNTSDHTDRLGLERFDAVAAPDQWADIVRRAESADSAGSNVVAMRRNRGWYLAAAASFVALIGGLVVVTQLRDGDGTTPIDQPSTDAVATACADNSDLDAITKLQSSGLPIYDYQPAADLAELVARNDVVVRAELSSAVRVDGAAPTDSSSGDLGSTVVTLSSVSVLSGDASIVVDGFETASGWADRSQADPLADSVTFEHLQVIAFLSERGDVPSGFTPDIEGWFVACDGGPAMGVIETPTFLDLTSLDALETQITGFEPDTTVTTEPAPTDTTSPSSPSTTEPDDTVPETAVVDVRWTPSCVDLIGSGNTPSGDTGLDRFGPLGAVPGLDIVLPAFQSNDQAAPAAVNVAVGRVDGGIAVLARPYEGEDTNTYLLSVVDDDGSIRWRRCLDGNYTGSVLTAPGAAQVVVGEYPPTNGDAAPIWHTFALDTGLDRDPIGVPAGLGQLVVDGPFVVFGPTDDRITTSDDRLAVLDLRTGTIGKIAFPPDLGIPAFRHDFEVIDDGSGAFRILQRVDGRQSAVRGVWVDGAWQSDDATILASTSVRAVLTFDERGWEGRNGLGEVVWSRPDLLDIRQEGFLSDVSDTVTVINACREQSDTGCVDGNLSGIDTATGNTLWERSGLRGVSAVGDGFALITNDDRDGWELIDTLTGALVDESQQWAGFEPFTQECCGAGDFVWVGRDGGVVFAVNQDHVRVWYPQGRSDETGSVSLTD